METLHSSATSKAIIVTNTIAFNEFLKHNFVQQYKTWLWFIALIVVCLFAYVGYQSMFGNTPVDVFPPFFKVFICYFFLVTPMIMYFQAKKYFKSTKYLKESITYTFTQEGVEAVGESFTSKTAWKNFYKIEEIKDWLLIYTDKYAAIRLQKKNFKSMEDLQALREIIKTHPIEQKLK